MKGRWKIATAMLALMFVVLSAGPAGAQTQEVFSQSRAAMSTSGFDRLTSYCSSTQYSMRYTDWLYCGDCEQVGYLVSVSGNGATSISSTQIEFALEDPTAGNVRYGTTGAQGFPLTTGWNYPDTSTSITKTSADIYITSTVVIRAPFCRLGFRQAKADNGDVLFTIVSFKRYTMPYYTPEHVGSLDDVVAADDVIAGDDVRSVDDLIGGDDLYVADDARIKDDLHSGDSFSSTSYVRTTLTVDTSVNAEDIATSGIRVGNTAAYGVATRTDWTSTTLTAGASTCTVTLPWTPDWTQDVIDVKLVPNDNLKLYAGHGYDYIVPEGGTTCEIKISSATFTTLYVFVKLTRLTAATID